MPNLLRGVQRKGLARALRWIALLLAVASALLGFELAQAPRHLQATRIPPGELKIMNYYPSSAGWEKMWMGTSSEPMDHDFHQIHQLGANTVRIIIQPRAVGYPVLSAAGASRFRKIMQLAKHDGLQVQLTLFDHWALYNQPSASEKWASALLAPYRYDSMLALVEIQNEINPLSVSAIAWARQMLAFVRTLLPATPRTIDVRGSNSPALLERLMASLPAGGVDVIDVHLYSTMGSNESVLTAAKDIAGGRPVIVGEAGATTYGRDEADAERDQLVSYEKTLQACLQLGIRFFAPWIFSDFTASGSEDGTVDNAEAHFGLRRLNGTFKPATEVVQRMFATTHG